MSDIILNDTFTGLATELRDLAEARRQIEAREREIKEVLASHLQAGQRGLDSQGTPLVAVRAGQRRFNPERARLRLPADTYAGLLTLQIDKDRARTVLAPALWDECCDITAPSVVAL